MRPEAPLALALMLALSASAAAKKPPPRAPELSNQGRASVMLAQSYLDSGKLDLAEHSARAALQSDAGSPLAHVTLAMVLAKRQQQEKAAEAFARALALAPGDGAVLNAHGAWLCERGDHARADESFRRALADPRFRNPAQPLANAGRCAMRAGEWVRADGYLRRAVKLAPTSRTVLLMLAETQLRLQRPFEARAFVQRSEALGQDADTLALAVRVEEAAGDAIAAARYRKRLQEHFSNIAPTGEGARTP